MAESVSVAWSEAAREGMRVGGVVGRSVAATGCWAFRGVGVVKGNVIDEGAGIFVVGMYGTPLPPYPIRTKLNPTCTTTTTRHTLARSRTRTASSPPHTLALCHTTEQAPRMQPVEACAIMR